jgi:hypothetical protein
VISSSPRMPVGHFSMPARALRDWVCFLGIDASLYCAQRRPKPPSPASVNRRKCRYLMHLSLASSIPAAPSGCRRRLISCLADSRENTPTRRLPSGTQIHRNSAFGAGPLPSGFLHGIPSTLALYKRRITASFLRNFPNLSGHAVCRGIGAHS